MLTGETMWSRQWHSSLSNYKVALCAMLELRIPAILLTAATLCVSIASAAPRETANQARTAKLILQLDDAWSKAILNHELERALSFYSRDAMVFVPNTPLLKGPKPIREAFIPFMSKSITLDNKATTVRVAKSCDMAWSYGTYTLSMPGASGKMIHDHGKWVEVWQKQSNGSWKCAADIFNSDLPAGT